MNRNSSVLRSVVSQQKEVLNLFCCHLTKETALLINKNNLFSVEKIEDSGEVDNIFELPEGDGMSNISYDILICFDNDNVTNQVSDSIVQIFDIPKLCVFTTHPPQEITPKFESAVNKLAGDMNIFTSDKILNSWKIKQGLCVVNNIFESNQLNDLLISLYKGYFK